MHPAEHLGRQDNVLPAGVTPDRPADNLLGRAELVDVRRIPERHPGLDGLPEERLSIVSSRAQACAPGVVGSP